MDFVHLHLHTEYSLLDGECRINALPAAVKANGQSYVAITDHGVLYGACDFFKACVAGGIKPIIGCEVYVSPTSMDNKQFSPENNFSYHLVLLAQNREGYENLTAIVSEAFTRGFYRKPRTDTAFLREHSNGLIALSGCMSGILAKRITDSNIIGAKETAREYKSIFGDRFYIELQRNGVTGQEPVNRILMQIAKEQDIPLVATNDVHYIKKEDAETQELLMAIATAGTLGDKSFAMEGEEFYLKSSDSMTELFSDCPEAVENTVKIAESCNFEYEFGKLHLPSFAVPDGYTPQSYLFSLCESGLEKRGLDSDEYRKRLEYELSVIHSMGFDDYFLIVWDFVAYARGQNIPVGPGRGSAVGSLAAYCLGITDVDPLKYGLLFERLLNPERVSMPDIDIDFCDERRGEVIDYVCRKYGKDHVAQIITFGTLACRAAIRDVGRALGMSYASVDEIAKLVPREMNITVDKALEQSAPLKEKYGNDFSVRRLIDFARKMEGRPRNSSTHATGVVVTDLPTTKYIPLSVNDNVVVTQFGMNTVAELGLLKIDFLGLRFLSILRNASESVAASDPGFDIEKIGFDDAKTYTMLSEGRSLGLFQLESEGMRTLLQKLCPRDLEDIISVISLYRPGPADSINTFLKNRADMSRVGYISSLLAPILDTTNGCIIYQEQVMQIFRTLAGYSYGRADIVRRAMAKKKHAEMEKERLTFVKGCGENGIDPDDANRLFDSMSSFASYAFNKSHAAAYAVVAYRTAYLKANYPKEYMCALLTSVMGSGVKVNEYITECKSMGIPVLSPSINESGRSFSVYGDHIRFGLAAVKNVGGGFADNVVKERAANGKYLSLEDFLIRTSGFIGLKAMQSLTLCGAFDCFGISRNRVYNALENAMSQLAGIKNNLIAGQVSLFDGIASEISPLKLRYPALDEYRRNLLLEYEKEYTGVYFSGHPLEQYSGEKKISKTVSIKDLYSNLKSGIIKDKSEASVLCQIKHNRPKMTKANKLMAFLHVEDISAETEIIVFPSVYEKFSSLLEEGEVAVLTGEVSMEEPYGGEGEDEMKFILRTAHRARPDTENTKKSLYLKITPENSNKLPVALDIARRYRGESRVCIYFNDRKRLVASKDITVDITPSLLAALTELLGDGCVKEK